MRTARLFALALCLSAAPLAAEGKEKDKGKDLVKWRTIAAGEAESTKTGKPVLYFMTADWCMPCHMMADEVFSDAKVAATINTTYVPIEVKDRRREEGMNAQDVQRVLSDYRVRGFPTLTVTRPGSLHAFQLPGWAGKKSTVDFLGLGPSRLAEMEKGGSAEEKP